MSNKKGYLFSIYARARARARENQVRFLFKWLKKSDTYAYFVDKFWVLVAKKEKKLGIVAQKVDFA